MSFLKKLLYLVFLLTVFFLAVADDSVFADENNADSLMEKLQEWEEQGIDPNHTEAINTINAYVEQHIDPAIFASLYIDREERELGVLVYSFTENISEKHKQAMRDLLPEHAEISYRVVEYTEEELVAKQQEMDFSALEKQGIAVSFTAVDITGNQVEVGIYPYNEKNVQMVNDQFGSEMINVIEADPISITDDGDTAAFNVEENKAKENNDVNFFQKIFSAIKSFFANLF